MTSALSRVLVDVLIKIGPVRVAVSGGVDSLTLMAFAHDVVDARAVHAVSPAVPPAATARVRELAVRLGWSLDVIDAGEIDDDEYLANPVDRCRVCKSHLYDALHALHALHRVDAAPSTGAFTVVSGTNVDDLGDYRPGLDAARERGVRHPFVEAGLDKRAVRALAHELGLHDVAELPAQPCLSSRIETGIRIDAPMLAMVNAVEDSVRERLGASVVVRCRVRAGASLASLVSRHVVIELDERALAALDASERAALVDAAVPLLRGAGVVDRAVLAPYRMGSAFLRVL